MEGAESVTSSKPESLETEDSTPVTNMEGTVVDSVDISSAGDNVAEDTETNYEGDEFATSTEFAASNEDDEEIVMEEQEEEEDDYDDDDFEPVDVFSGAGPKNDDFPDDPNQEDSDEEDDEAVLARAHKEDMLQGHASEKPEADYDENSSTTASSSAQLSTVGTTDVAKLKLENEHLTMMLNSFKVCDNLKFTVFDSFLTYFHSCCRLRRVNYASLLPTRRWLVEWLVLGRQ